LKWPLRQLCRQSRSGVPISWPYPGPYAIC
jgi:hypothetical protein